MHINWKRAQIWDLFLKTPWGDGARHEAKRKEKEERRRERANDIMILSWMNSRVVCLEHEPQGRRGSILNHLSSVTLPQLSLLLTLSLYLFHHIITSFLEVYKWINEWTDECINEEAENKKMKIKFEINYKVN